MTIVALEEHFVTNEVIDAWQRLDEPDREDAVGQLRDPERHRRLLDFGEERLRIMDEEGVDRAILSLTTPGTQNMAADEAVALAAATNDRLAAEVRARPDRYGGFATLPTPDPEAAARELRRAVRELGLDGAMLNGRTGDCNLDAAEFRPIFDTANELRAPIYLHPQLPAPPVREQLYGGFDKQVSQMFAQAAPGWHYETGVQLLRLILAGTFDRCPDLQLVTGHWGETILFYLDRVAMLDEVAKLDRPIRDYFRTNISVTGSGIWSQRYLGWAKEVLGADRLLCATDYPYVSGDLRGFIDAADLTDAERAAVTHGNWDRLTSAIRR